jgi:hypothetical protein
LATVLVDPVGHTLGIDFQHTANRAITTAFHIHADCQEARLIRVAVLLGLRCIHSIGFSTPRTLASRGIEARFGLLLAGLVFWTVHASYFILFPILGSPKSISCCMFSIESTLNFVGRVCARGVGYRILSRNHGWKRTSEYKARRWKSLRGGAAVLVVDSAFRRMYLWGKERMKVEWMGGAQVDVHVGDPDVGARPCI